MDKKIIILDTETASNYVYDVGLIVAELRADNQYHVIERHQFIVEQIYNNKPLFKSAYYGWKIKKYISLLKGRKAVMKKFGYITRIINGIVKRNKIEKIYAYNSGFDESKLNFTISEFKVQDPFKYIKWVDIMGIAYEFIHKKKDYIDFITKHNLVNPSGYIKTSAETTYQFIINSIDFEESHTALADCEIELSILNYAIKNGYKGKKTYSAGYVKSNKVQTFTIIHKGQAHHFNYTNKRSYKKKNKIVLK